ncbi:MAG: hypothetical protein ACI9JM_001713 [Halioglobus sp.]|jgi:uncharacterized protein (DUF1330 family)
MEYHNALEPNEEQIAGFLAPDDDQPIYMLNLLKYKDKAEYADGRDTELSGQEAYQIYGMAVLERLAAVKGGIVFSGSVSRLMLGEVEDMWDDVAIAMYPSRAAMLEMVSSPEYQAIAVHREAGLAGQLNIETHAQLAASVS